MPLFVTISADDIGVSWGVVTGLSVVAGRAGIVPGLESAIAGAERSNLFDFLLGQLLPDDLSGFFWLQFGLDSGDLVEPLVIILDGLQVAGHLHALVEGVLLSLQDFVTEAILESGKKQLMFNELEGVRNVFGLGFGDGGSCGSDDGHGGWLVVGRTLVGRLDPIDIIVDGLLRFLIQIGEVGAGGLGRVPGNLRA